MINQNGTLSSIPFAMVWLFTTCSSFLSDRIIEKKWLSRTVVRKLANLIGSIIPAITLIGMCFITKTTARLGIVLLSVGMGAFGVAYGSEFLCVCNDMSSNYASIMFGISNTLATLPGIIAPFLISRITKNHERETMGPKFGGAIEKCSRCGTTVALDVKLAIQR
ncbi:hypothetical protein GJ496_003991 [Pomphorhynchus laevis]|nr:hypothetical protein GJ496_003991 [Pomphorhynchus laevis]